MLESEIIHLRLFATYQEFAATHPVGATFPPSREVDEIWEQIERLEAAGR